VQCYLLAPHRVEPRFTLRTLNLLPAYAHDLCGRDLIPAIRASRRESRLNLLPWQLAEIVNVVGQ
jgi:hypothetical protein